MVAHMGTAEDPLSVLASWLDRMDVTTQRTEASLHRNERNRLNLLVLHGVAAIVIAPLFALQTAGPYGMAAPSWVALRQIPNAPLLLALILGVGGLILVPATIARHRPAEMVGLTLLALWYLTLAVGFGVAIIIWTNTGRSGASRPGLYTPGLYGHLSVIMFVHMVTLYRLNRKDRRRR